MAALAMEGQVHTNVISAIEALQIRALREQRIHEGDVLEEALADLVRSPHRSADPRHLAGSALARARTKVHRRATLVPLVAAAESLPDADTEPKAYAHVPLTDDESAHALIEVRDALHRSDMAPRDRGYLRLASQGYSARDIAGLEGVRPETAEVRLSRTHSRARAAWAAA